MNTFCILSIILLVNHKCRETHLTEIELIGLLKTHFPNYNYPIRPVILYAYESPIISSKVYKCLLDKISAFINSESEVPRNFAHVISIFCKDTSNIFANDILRVIFFIYTLPYAKHPSDLLITHFSSCGIIKQREINKHFILELFNLPKEELKVFESSYLKMDDSSTQELDTFIEILDLIDIMTEIRKRRNKKDKDFELLKQFRISFNMDHKPIIQFFMLRTFYIHSNFDDTLQSLIEQEEWFRKILKFIESMSITKDQPILSSMSEFYKDYWYYFKNLNKAKMHVDEKAPLFDRSIYESQGIQNQKSQNSFRIDLSKVTNNDLLCSDLWEAFDNDEFESLSQEIENIDELKGIGEVDDLRWINVENEWVNAIDQSLDRVITMINNIEQLLEVNLVRDDVRNSNFTGINKMIELGKMEVESTNEKTRQLIDLNSEVLAN